MSSVYIEFWRKRGLCETALTLYASGIDLVVLYCTPLVSVLVSLMAKNKIRLIDVDLFNHVRTGILVGDVLFQTAGSRT